MRFNFFSIALQIASELMALKSMGPGEEVDLPVIHAKSGTTNLEITIVVKQDPAKTK